MGTLLDYLGGVDTPLCRVPVPNNRGKLSKYLGEGWSISQLLLGPHTPNTFWRFLGHIEIFLDYVRGVQTPVGRVWVPRNKAKLSKYMGSGEVNISASIKASCNTFIWEVSETYRNICRPLERC